MVFSTYHPTRYRSWIGYLSAICVVAAIAGAASGLEIGIIIAVLAPVVLHLGWFVLIALDVRELGDDLGGGATKWAYPLLVMLGFLGVVLYLWDRERNLPNVQRRKVRTRQVR